MRLVGVPARFAQPGWAGPACHQTKTATGTAVAAAAPAIAADISAADATRASTAGGDHDQGAEPEDDEPGCARVAARAERVNERDRPGGIREPVHAAPDPQLRCGVSGNS